MAGGTSQPRSKIRDFAAAAEVELLDAALTGDIEAFAHLHERYRHELNALCLRRLTDPSLAEDAVQEIFIKAFRNLPKFDRSKPFWPWLATVAFRICIDFERRRYRARTQYSGDIGVTMVTKSNGQPEPLLVDAVVDRAELEEALRDLPKRQRRALLLYALDGWSYADIASAEGISVGAVKLLLVRARRKMRIRFQRGPLAPVVLPYMWLRGRFQRAEKRIGLLLDVRGEGWAAAGLQAVSLGLLAAMAVTMHSSGNPVEAGDSTRFDEAVISASQSGVSTADLQNPGIAISRKSSAESQQSASDPARSLVDDVINSNQNATPENTELGTVTASPNYESDHTMLATGCRIGRSGCEKRVLFVSHDGGGTWQSKPSLLLDGSTMLLPPDFPHDRRMFVRGGLGLQQSDDGGQIFRTVSSALGSGAAISPSFGKGNSKILLGGKTILEFDASTGVTRPALLALPLVPPYTSPATPWAAEYSSIAFSPDYPSESTIFVSESRGGFYRCNGLICDETRFWPGPLSLRLSPRCDQDGLTYAFTPYKLLVSHDRARTFEKIRFPVEFREFSGSRSIRDVAILCNALSDPAMFVSVSWQFTSPEEERPFAGIYRSFDAGHSWSKTFIDLPGYGLGSADRLIVTPTGRLLAVGTSSGIACSEDGGQIWAPRCTPEQ